MPPASEDIRSVPPSASKPEKCPDVPLHTAQIKCPFADTPTGTSAFEHPMFLGRESLSSIARFVVESFREGLEFIGLQEAVPGVRQPSSIWYSPSALYQALTFSSDPHSVFHWIHENYGDYAQLRAPNGQRFLFIADAEIIDGVLRGTDGGRIDNFNKSPLFVDGLHALSPNTHNSLLASSDEAWKARHEAIQPPFRRTNFEKPEVTAKIEGAINRALDELAETVKRAGSDGLPVDLQEEMSLIALRVAYATLLDLPDVSRDELEAARHAFRQFFSAFPLEAITPGSFPFHFLSAFSSKSAEVASSVDFLQHYADELIVRIKEQPDNPSNPVHRLLKVAESNEHSAIDPKFVRSELLTLLLASHETSGNLMASTLSAASLRPDLMHQLYDEADLAQALAGAGLDKRKDALPITYQTIQEGLRLYPPVYAILRRATADTTISTALGEVVIPKDSEVILNLFDAHRDSQQWGIEGSGYSATAFAPERWSKENVESHGIKASKVFSFGGGSRVCVGAHFALTEFLELIPSFLARFTITPNFTSIEESLTSDGTLQRRGGFPVTLALREPIHSVKD